MAECADTHKIMKFESWFIHSFRPEDKKDLLDIKNRKDRLVKYHYTSASTVMKILNPSVSEETVLRFTDIRYMNDKSERLFFVRQLLRFMDRNKGKYPFCEEVVNRLLLKLQNKDAYIGLTATNIRYAQDFLSQYQNRRCFVFCTSGARDSLQMWNYYTHNGAYQGYNIGFDIYTLLKTFDVEDGEPADLISIFYGRVLYDEEEQFQEIEKLLEKLERNHQNEDVETRYSSVATSLRHYIESRGIFFKSEAFAGEREYRIVVEISEERLLKDNSRYIKENQNNSKIALDYFERGGVIVPCLNIQFPKNVVTSLTMPPIMEHELAQESLKEYLKVHGYRDVAVVRSEIPVRF